jgi:hypothetical protein
VRERLAGAGAAVAARHTWDAVAARHEAAYRAFLTAREPLAG